MVDSLTDEAEDDESVKSVNGERWLYILFKELESCNYQ